MGKINQLPGGLGDNKRLTDFDPKQLRMGVKVEMEHTDDPLLALEITMDHLTEDPEYYTHLKEMEDKYQKSEDVNVVPGTDREIVPGAEPLAKPPKSEAQRRFMRAAAAGDIKDVPPSVGKEFSEKDPGGKLPERISKSIVDRWSVIRKALVEEEDGDNDTDPQTDTPPQNLDNSKSFMSVLEQQDEDEPDTGEPKAQEPEEGSDVQPGQADTATADSDAGDQDAGEEQDLGDDPVEHLKQLGYSDTEINYILHGHVVPSASLDFQQAQQEQSAAQQEQDHGSKLNELELAHQQAMYALEQQKQNAELQGMDPDAHKNHAKRMLDLEHEFTRKERELELEFKRKELELKLKQKEDAAKAKKKESKDED